MTTIAIYIAIGIALSFFFYTDKGRVITDGWLFIVFVFIWPLSVAYFVWAALVKGCSFKYNDKVYYRWKGLK